ncbi:hypothetical protein AO1008_06480 [Aspergillus oryzae 100-8]|uniref:Uncharacterized protein n=1 Tax=Aspergillus oryzae (strain 3.042) TaxID=1160506 RepID=I8IJA8_ASPO3|nr:hypothetical protein Ao3042_04791 [Aspergillus oryzae 3.042]KDE80039.1 hypothetical protein AO1008_06480 [Aspergillus oryzae 100-8]|eukprot:EIT78901.1 hypothetical protein Ao3042_04791 [Aspergillus oryzae 3.042]
MLSLTTALAIRNDTIRSYTAAAVLSTTSPMMAVPTRAAVAVRTSTLAVMTVRPRASDAVVAGAVAIMTVRARAAAAVVSLARTIVAVLADTAIIARTFAAGANPVGTSAATACPFPTIRTGADIILSTIRSRTAEANTAVVSTFSILSAVISHAAGRDAVVRHTDTVSASRSKTSMDSTLPKGGTDAIQAARSTAAKGSAKKPRVLAVLTIRTFTLTIGDYRPWLFRSATAAAAATTTITTAS